IDALADDVALRRDPVIGQAVPGRETEDVDLRVEEGDGLGKLGEARIVARHVQQARRTGRGGPAAGELAQDEGIVAFGRAGDERAARAGQHDASTAQDVPLLKWNRCNSLRTSVSSAGGTGARPVSQS